MKTENLIVLDATVRHGVSLNRENLAEEIVKLLSLLYVDAGYATSPDAFKQQHFHAMMADPNFNAADMEFAIQESMENIGGFNYVEMLRVSCAYCVSSIRAEKSGEYENALLLLGFAQHYLGMASAIRFVKSAAKLAYIESGREGGLTAGKRYEKVKQFVEKEAQPHLEWSKTEIANRIKESVLNFSRSEGIKVNLTEGNAIRQICKYLANVKCGGKRRPRKKNTKG